MIKLSLGITVSLICIVSCAPNIVAQPGAGTSFIDFITRRLAPEHTSTTKKTSSTVDISKFCNVEKSAFARRVFTEYGAMFVASSEVTLPKVCYFPGEKSATHFQSKLRTKSAVIDGTEIKLQGVAMDALLAAVIEALQNGTKISPFDGSIAAARSYGDTVGIWNSRFDPALQYWTTRGKIAAEDAAQIRTLPLEQQVDKVIEWESRRFWFGTTRTASIFSSTAPPGASQHLALIAFDVARLPSPKIAAIFNSHGWYQTVKGDPQHFTYLGVSETELQDRGLRSIRYGGVKYWVPNVTLTTLPN